MSHATAAAAVAHGLASILTADGTSLFELSPNGILAVDRAGIIQYVNAPLLRMFGYQRDELVGQPVEALVPAKFAAVHERHRHDFGQRRGDRPMGSADRHLVGTRRDGTEFPVDIALGTVARGDVEVTFAIVMDLTAHRSVESRLQEVSRAYTTLEALTWQMRGGRDEAAVFELACNLAVVEGRYLGAWVAQPDEHGRVRVRASAGPIDRYLSGLSITLDPVTPGPIAVAFTRGIPTYIEDFDAHAAATPWIKAAREHGIRACATVPVRQDSEIVAVLVFYAGRPDVFDPEMRAVLEGIASTVRTHLEHTRSTERLREAEHQRSALLESLILAEERERSKIAGDVHDDSIGALAAVRLRLGGMRTRISTLAPELDELMGELQAAVATAAERLRTLLFDLETPDPDVDLLDALRSAAAFIFADSDARWHVDGTLDRPPDPISYMQILRIAKEALLNVRVHSHATTVRVTAGNRDHGVELVIEDNGVGFDPEQASRPGHRGLATMQDRAQLGGGTLDIRPAVGGGTTIALWLPTTGVDAR